MNIKKVMLVIFAIIVLVANIFIAVEKSNETKKDFLNNLRGASSNNKNVIEQGQTYNEIAVLSIDGAIQEGAYHESFMDNLEKIKNSDDVKGVIIKLNTPGGGVYESVQIYEKIKQIKEVKKIPFYASMGSIAASGGYYVSAICDRIYAKEETTTGSIGVIMSSTNFSKLFEKYGVTEDVIKSGEFKDIGSSSKTMSERDRAILQSLVDNAYNKFVKIVAEGRKMSEAKVRKIADGRIYDGKQALEIGLIDKYGFFEDALEDMKKDLSLDNPNVVSYDYDESFKSLFSILGSTMQNLGKSELQKNIDTIKSMQNSANYTPMYLYGGM